MTRSLSVQACPNTCKTVCENSESASACTGAPCPPGGMRGQLSKVQ